MNTSGKILLVAGKEVEYSQILKKLSHSSKFYTNKLSTFLNHETKQKQKNYAEGHFQYVRWHNVLFNWTTCYN